MTTKTETEKVFYIKIKDGKTFTNPQGGDLVDLIDELGWDYQRLGESGREIYDKICHLLCTVPENEVYMEI